MALRFFNTGSRSVQEFVPLDAAGRAVGIYCCGPTVYDFAHIGNFRTFVFADLVRRYLELGYRVTHVMNITDVEDKIIARVRSATLRSRTYTAQLRGGLLQGLTTPWAVCGRITCRARPSTSPRSSA